ncbi:hypothetical protein FH972_025146 [Carpinus fangiana]|uniref:3-hydroxyacyl-CoA dehydrogenase type-2 n=1 Tax=Carpinus fangiana TaxID=176857 RepID=A0A5N6L059_9ROSI|nr:hypothetical protein FH972_025146 [Carpinus fangiana]KAB8446164.1 hypothetical protein FH972_025146 [Carpinus fangiana]
MPRLSMTLTQLTAATTGPLSASSLLPSSPSPLLPSLAHPCTPLRTPPSARFWSRTPTWASNPASLTTSLQSEHPSPARLVSGCFASPRSALLSASTNSRQTMLVSQRRLRGYGRHRRVWRTPISFVTCMNNYISTAPSRCLAWIYFASLPLLLLSCVVSGIGVPNCGALRNCIHLRYARAPVDYSSITCVQCQASDSSCPNPSHPLVLNCTNNKLHHAHQRQNLCRLRRVRLPRPHCPIHPIPPANTNPPSASGLGQATVQDLHAHGGYVAILDLNEDAGAAAVAALGSRAKFFQVDVTASAEVKAAADGIVAWTQETRAPLGAVVAAAGVGFPGKAIDRKGRVLSLDSFDAVVNINLRGSVDLVLQLLPALVGNAPSATIDGVEATSLTGGEDAERGVLVLVSSVAAFDGQPGQLAYAASKGAIASLVLPLARDLAEYGIRVVAIAPGVFESAMTGMMSQKVKKSLEGVMEFPKRMGKGVEFARMVREVIGNAMLNATVIRLDGAVRMPSKM